MRLNLQTKVWRAAVRLVRRTRALIAAIAAASLVVTASVVSATTYEYDVHGRLTKVTTEDGSVVLYMLDETGNRFQALAYAAPAVPASISAPATSSTGSFTVSWSAASGSVSHYELYEATNPSFSGETLVYGAAATSHPISGKGNGTYYYRVRACNTVPCSGFRESSGTTVLLPPGIPASISVPSSGGSGSYTVSWGTASGSVTSYELYEATNTSFTGQTLAYSGGGTSHGVTGKGPGTYYYRVRACNGSSCSDYRTGANGATVSPGIQVLNPAISVSWTGQLTSIAQLANLNGHSATIHSFTLNSCWQATATIQSGAQTVRWTNDNYYNQCEFAQDVQCSASYVIRNSGTGQLHNGSSSVTIVDQFQSLPPGTECP